MTMTCSSSLPEREISLPRLSCDELAVSFANDMG